MWGFTAEPCSRWKCIISPYRPSFSMTHWFVYVWARLYWALHMLRSELFFQCLQVSTRHVSQIPAQSRSCHQNWMSCRAASSRQFSKQMHADSTFDLVACQRKCLEFVLTACAIYCNWDLRSSKIRLLCVDSQPLKLHTQPGGKQWEIGGHISIMQESNYKNTICSTITVHSLYVSIYF